MGPAGALARAWVQRNAATTVLLALLVTLVVGAAGGAFAGARRASSALDRFMDYNRPPHLQVYGEDLDLQAVTSLPQVAGWATGSYGLLTVEGPGGGPFSAGDVNPFLSIEADGERTLRPYVVEGREPDGGDAQGVAVDEEASARLGAGVGDELEVRLFLPEQIEELYDSGGDFPVPRGRTTTVTVTGIVRQPFDVTPTKPEGVDAVMLASSDLYFTSAFWDEHGEHMAAFGDGTDGAELLLRGGPSDIPAVEDAVRRMPAGDGISVEASNDVVTAVADARQTVRFEAVALATFGGLAVLAGAVLVAQAISRQVRAELAQRHVLVGMGFTRRDLARAAGLRSAPVAAGGALLGMVLAWLTSAWMPLGLAASAEIDPGLRLDLLPIGAVGLAAVLAVPAWSGLVGWRTKPAAISRSRPGFGAHLARRAGSGGAPVGVVTGLSHLSPTRSRTPLVGSLGAVVFGIALVTGIAMWATTLERFVDEPDQHGWTWDLIVGDSDDPELATAGEELLGPNPDVGGYAAVWGGYEDTVTVLGERPQAVATAGIDSLAGGTYISLRSGRPAAAEDEVVVGARTLERAGAELGGTIAVEGPRGRAELEVVGVAVLHQLVSDDFELDQGLVTTSDGLRALFSGPEVEVGDTVHTDGVLLNRFLVDVSEGSTVAQATASLRRDFGPTVAPHLPPLDVASLRGTRALPWVLGALVGILSVASLFHFLVTTVRRRRRDFAVLAALGATGSLVRTSVISTATATVLIAALAGLPIGLVAGRTAWSVLADSIGAPTAARAPVPGILGALVSILIVSNGVAAVPGRVAARLRPAEILRSE